MAFLKRRGKYFYIAYYRDGKRVVRSTRTKERKLAKKLLRKVEEKLEGEQCNQPRIPCSQYLSEYLSYCKTVKTPDTVKCDIQRLNSFLLFICRLRSISPECQNFQLLFLDEITTREIELYKQDLLNNKKRSTASRDLQTIKAFFNYAEKIDLLKENPVKKVSNIAIRNGKPNFLSESDIAKLFEELSKEVPMRGPGQKGNKCRQRQTPLFEIASVAYYGGLRLSEIINLEWQDIDLERNLIKIRIKEGFSPKNFKERIIPLHPILKQRLLEYRNRTNNDGNVFLNKNGRLFNRCNLTRELKRVSSKLNLQCHWYILRHSFASNLALKGTPLKVISELLGNSVKVTEMHYVSVAPENLHSYVEKLG